MKKKIIYQHSIKFILVLGFLLAILGMAVYVIIAVLLRKQIASPWEWIGFCSAIICGGIIIFTILNISHCRVVFNENEIFVPGHWTDKTRRIQYETHIKYSDIKDIFLIKSNNNSHEQPIRWATYPMTYIVFELVSGKQLINVFYYSNKQIIKIINETISRIGKENESDTLLKGGNEILKEYFSVHK